MQTTDLLYFGQCDVLHKSASTALRRDKTPPAATCSPLPTVLQPLQFNLFPNHREHLSRRPSLNYCLSFNEPEKLLKAGDLGYIHTTSVTISGDSKTTGSHPATNPCYLTNSLGILQQEGPQRCFIRKSTHSHSLFLVWSMATWVGKPGLQTQSPNSFY